MSWICDNIGQIIGWRQSPASTDSIIQSVNRKISLCTTVVPVWFFPIEVTLGGTIVPPENPKRNAIKH